VLWLWGGFSVANPTLNKFFSFIFYSLYYLGISGIHLILLIILDHLTHWFNVYTDKTSFTPYYTIKDFLAFLDFLCIYSISLFCTDLLGHPDNYIPANPDVTPAILFLNGISTFLCDLTCNSDKAFGVLAF
jgi:quinol-cytochrome oxidoreductase complex cytochrome b subunit